MKRLLRANNRFHPARSSLLASYLSLPGTSGNYASSPDSAAASIVGDIDIRVKAALNDWTPANSAIFVAKFASNTTRSYALQINTGSTGRLTLYTSPDGTSGNQVSGVSTAAVGAADAADIWIRATLDVNDGAGNRVYTFYTSTDGDSWSQLGDVVTTAGATTIHDNNSILEVGAFITGTSGLIAGKIYLAQVYSGIGGTLVADFDATRSLVRQTYVAGSTGEVWTINRSGATPAAIV